MSLMNMWTGAYVWMKSHGMPITPQQEGWISQYPPVNYGGVSLKNMAYYLTEHFENLKWPGMPEEVKKAIEDYKIEMMDLWGWPEWGYKDVMQFKKLD